CASPLLPATGNW
nr:immunoglobulin heavy chain junction region [Macaca mulatta]MOX60766.1 immunoglobulin heavy chain junction region [Macaca mulatta]MOX62166.1 immunoglobulin heavy chain junction region [Macaca mulatta]MOX63259.1 immunoglobulin heavy chain junction region [Macaca mulatta]MOX63472.1 immunoglobulin heavy chain junction region [Macaca mulatta]